MAKSTAGWLHEQQRDWVRQHGRSWLWRSELPTWMLIVAIYGGWFATLAFWQMLGLLPATLLLIWFTTWYMSLQHELIHGHPTRSPRVNQLLGLMPLAVWYPYGLYRDAHLAHHRTHLLTQPEDDPESYYIPEWRWRRYAPWQRKLITLRNTFPGRLLLAPALDIVQLLIGMLTAFRRLDWRGMADVDCARYSAGGNLCLAGALRVFNSLFCAGGQLSGAGVDEGAIVSGASGG